MRNCSTSSAEVATNAEISSLRALILVIIVLSVVSLGGLCVASRNELQRYNKIYNLQCFKADFLLPINVAGT
jgi:hypothetical protein